MSTDLSPPPRDAIDIIMLKVARDLAQDIYPAEDILKKYDLSGDMFEAFKRHPRFQGYLISEREAWLSANNIESRTKLKAGMVLETFMDGAYQEISDRTQPLNQRVELGKMLAKIAGFGEPKAFINTGGGGPGFTLQINIGPGVANEGRHETITIQPEVSMPPDIRMDDEEEVTLASNFPPALKNAMLPPEEDDEYDPFTSPSTLEEDEQ
jgi:hypothetical protein